MSTKRLKVKTMKFKCFTLIVILVIMFSLGAVSASENITSDADLAVSSDLIDESLETQDILSSEDSSSNETDLSVKIDVTNIYKGNLFNRAGFEVPWTITVTVNNGTAVNTRVYETLSENMEYVSHNASTGEYDPISGIWYVGDLSSSDNASLKILTKLKTDGRFKNSVNVVTDSNDIDLSNNVKSLTIKSGTSKTTSNVTETSDDKNEAQHDDHFGSESTHSVAREVEDDDVAAEDSPADQANSGSKLRAAEVSEPSQSSSSGANNAANEKSSNSVAKTINSITEKVSDTFESITASVISIFDSSSDDSDKGDSNSSNPSSKAQAKSIAKSDYTKIPMLIFGLFLIALVAYFGYNKIKS